MKVEKTSQQIEDEHIETVLLYVIADSFGREKFRARHKAILALMEFAKRFAKGQTGRDLTSLEAFRVLCQKQVDFRGLID